MIGTSTRSEMEARPLIARPVVLALAVVVGLLVAVVGALGGVAVMVASAPPGATLGVQDGAGDLPLSSEIPVSLTGWDSRLDYAALYETPINPDGSLGAERPVPLQGNVQRESRTPEGMDLTLRPASGTLNADANYRLVVQASALTAAFPWPKPASLDREVRFSTLRSPSPRPIAGPVRLKWNQPLQIEWSAPVEDVRYEVTPSTPLKTTLDQSRRVSSVVLEDPADDQTYHITVAQARGANGIALARPAAYDIVPPSRPKLLENDEPKTVEVGKPLTLKWSVPIDRVALAIEPEAKTSWQVDKRDPTVVLVSLDGLAQGESYEMKVTEAVSRDGAPLRESPTVAFETPERLMVEDLDTGTDVARVPVKTKPIIIFAQPIRDRRAAQAALSVEPNIPGRWEWLDDQRVQFSPIRTLPYDAEVTFKIRPGLDGARSVTGSYFENQAVLSFVTEADKLIDVDVTRQSMTLYQEGRLVRTFAVATGVPGADTPIGEFNVEYKMPTARFVGVNVSGSRYDIPDVHWVLAFSGDYTIHGAYWRAAFGSPGSNGCVSLTDTDAKAVFDWAPEGTRIHIHY